MWLSKRVSKNNGTSQAEVAKLTISGNSQWEASGSATSRNVQSYTPYGYSYSAPVGENVLVIPSANGQVALGIKMLPAPLERGEVQIASAGGAFITLKNDGSVVINGLVINSKGEIEND